MNGRRAKHVKPVRGPTSVVAYVVHRLWYPKKAKEDDDQGVDLEHAEQKKHCKQYRECKFDVEVEGR